MLKNKIMLGEFSEWIKNSTDFDDIINQISKKEKKKNISEELQNYQYKSNVFKGYANEKNPLGKQYTDISYLNIYITPFLSDKIPPQIKISLSTINDNLFRIIKSNSIPGNFIFGDEDEDLFIDQEILNDKVRFNNNFKDILDKFNTNLPNLSIKPGDMKFISEYLTQKSDLKTFSKDLSRIAYIVEDPLTNTLSIGKVSDKTDDYILKYNSNFIMKTIIYEYFYSEFLGLKESYISLKVLSYLIGHELLHFRFNHFDKGVTNSLKSSYLKTTSEIQNLKRINNYLDSNVNIQCEMMINHVMSKILNCEVVDGGISTQYKYLLLKKMKEIGEYKYYYTIFLLDEAQQNGFQTGGAANKGIISGNLIDLNKKIDTSNIIVPITEIYPLMSDIINIINAAIAIDEKRLNIRSIFKINELYKDTRTDIKYKITSTVFDSKGKLIIYGINIKINNIEEILDPDFLSKIKEPPGEPGDGKPGEPGEPEDGKSGDDEPGGNSFIFPGKEIGSRIKPSDLEDIDSSKDNSNKSKEIISSIIETVKELNLSNLSSDKDKENFLDIIKKSEEEFRDFSRLLSTLIKKWIISLKTSSFSIKNTSVYSQDEPSRRISGLFGREIDQESNIKSDKLVIFLLDFSASMDPKQVVISIHEIFSRLIKADLAHSILLMDFDGIIIPSILKISNIDIISNFLYKFISLSVSSNPNTGFNKIIKFLERKKIKEISGFIIISDFEIDNLRDKEYSEKELVIIRKLYNTPVLFLPLFSISNNFEQQNKRKLMEVLNYISRCKGKLFKNISYIDVLKKQIKID